MAQHEMPTKLVAEPERSLEIDRRAHLPLPQGRACQGFERCLDRKGSGFDRHHGKARPRTGDGRADRDCGRVKCCGDCQIEEPGTEQCRSELGAAFDEEPRDAPFAKCGQGRGEIDLTLTVAIYVDQNYATLKESSTTRWICRAQSQDPGRHIARTGDETRRP